MFVLFVRNLFKKLLLCQISIFAILFKLFLDLLFLRVLAPVDLRLLNAIHILVFSCNQPHKVVKGIALSTEFLFILTLLFLHIFLRCVTLNGISLASECDLCRDCSFQFLFIHQTYCLESLIKYRVRINRFNAFLFLLNNDPWLCNLSLWN